MVSPGHDAPFPKLTARRRAEQPLIRLTASERSQLQRWVRSRTQRHRTVVRSRIVLLASRGLTVTKIATQAQVAAGTVRLWCRRFQEGGVTALERDARGRGRPDGMTRDLVLSVLRAMQHASHTQRSVRRLAAVAGTSVTTVWRVWRRFGLGAGASAEEIDSVIEKLISETHRA